MPRDLGCTSYEAELLPDVLTIARFYTTRPGNAASDGVRTDNDVLLTKLNDYQLGGVYISLAI